MDQLLVLDVLSRWVHVLTAIVLLGGSFFLRFMTMPAAAALDDDDHQLLRQRIIARWRKVVGVGIALLLISGFYNYLKVALPSHRGDSLYHALMGTKIILAFAVFFLASALTGRSAAMEPIRRNSGRWLAVTILLSTLIVGIAGYLKVARHKSTFVMPPPQPAVAVDPVRAALS